MIPIETFIKLFDSAKLLKKRFILIDKFAIYGTDEEYSSLSMIFRSDSLLFPESNYNSIAFDKNEIVSILKNAKAYAIRNCQIIDPNKNNLLWIGHGSEIHRRMTALIDSFGYHMNSPIKSKVFIDEDVTSRADIMSILNSKVSEGAELYNLEDNMITVFGGMYPINKNDKCKYTLYDLKDGTLLSEMKIIKSKGTIMAYYRYRNFNI